MTSWLERPARWLTRLVYQHRATIAGACFFVGMALVIFRGNLGIDSSGYPQGTNALNSYTLLSFKIRYPVSTWLYPYTDWGQPFPGYPGIDLLSGAAIVNPFGLTALVRLTEFFSFAGAGFALFWVLRRAGQAFLGSLVAGTFYALMAETSQFFDGHVPAMITIALAPLLFFFTFSFFRRPTPVRAVALALVTFVLLTSGDLGVTYMFGVFDILLAIVIIVERNLRAPYRLRELLAIGWSGSILLVGLLPWIVGYAVGVNPQYTTSIVSGVKGFNATAGQHLWLSFIGFVGDNSYTVFYLHSAYYALDFGLTAPLFFLLPILTGIYVLASKRRLLQLLYASGSSRGSHLYRPNLLLLESS